MMTDESSQIANRSSFKRIAIFGRPGSGKSTFAYHLSLKTGLPCYHLDKIFFGPGWVERPSEDFLIDQREWVKKDTWIIDGNSFRSLEMRYANADLCLYFELPFWVCCYRIFKRIITKDGTTDDRAEHCPERLNLKLLWYCLRLRKRTLPKLKTLKELYPNVLVLTVRSRKEVRELLASLSQKR